MASHAPSWRLVSRIRVLSLSISAFRTGGCNKP